MTKTNSFKIHIVLVAPKMPSNTGNIIRLCANTGAVLHLVKPLGFDLDDKKLRRAGLDYHEYAHMQVHDDWQHLKNSLSNDNCHTLLALTTKQSRPFYDVVADYVADKKQKISQTDNQTSNSIHLALVFGSETNGLPDDIREDIGQNNWLRLPMLPTSRSLNLSNSVAICLYEVWRLMDFAMAYDVKNDG